MNHKGQNSKREFIENTPLYVDSKKVIYGNAIDKSPTPITQLKNSGTVTVWGDIFNLEIRDMKREDYKILTFHITDYTSSVSVRIFDNKEIIDSIVRKMKNAKTFIIKGKYDKNEFSDQWGITPISIESVEKYEKKDTAGEKRVELHIHTNYSELDGISSPTDIINRAAQWGHKAIAITDHGVVQGLPEAYKAAQKAGIKLILGMEGYFVDDEKYPDFMNMKISDFEYSHITVLIKEDTSFDETIPKAERKYGRRNLYEIISHSHIKTLKNRPLIPKSLLKNKRDSLLIGSACQQGELYKEVTTGKTDEEIERIASFYDYIEIQPNNDIAINKKLIAIADEVGKPIVATGNAHFLEEKDAKFRAIIMASKGFDNTDNQALYFKTTDEMLNDFAWAGNRAKEFVIDNPNKIADMVMDNIPPIPKGKFYPYIENSDKELIEKCESHARALYGNPLPEYVDNRLKKELAIIIEHNYSMHYIVAMRLVEESKRNGYLVFTRGLTASSFITYLIGITDVNPLVPHYYCKKCKHTEFIQDGTIGSGFDLPIKNCPVCGETMNRDGQEIPFETFLGFNGDKEPDIILTFSEEYQLCAHRYTEKLFGMKYVFNAGTMATVADKTAYGYVMKYLDEQNIVDTPRAEIDRLIAGCIGIKHTTGQHPGRLVIIPDGYTVEDFTPIQYPSNDFVKAVYTTHFGYRNSLNNTLFKIDELGHSIPTLYKYLEEFTGIKISDVDLCDSKLYELLTSCKPLGIDSDDINCETGTLALPELDTPFVIEMLKKIQPKSFVDLLKVSSLSHGTDVWLDNAEHLLDQDICTVSDVIACREDIMVNLLHKCNDYEKKTGHKSPLTKKDCFDIMECVRKGNAVKKLSAYENAMKEIGIEQWYIDSCYKIKYMFPKAHAAAYVIAALRLAWYKLYYPTQFYSAYFTVYSYKMKPTVLESKKAVKKKMYELKSKDFIKTLKEENEYKFLQVVMEMLARGIEFLPVDLYKSDCRIYKIEGNRIILPFSVVPGIGEDTARSIYRAARDGNGEFISSEDLIVRAGINKSAVESLKKAGILNNIPNKNQASLF